VLYPENRQAFDVYTIVCSQYIMSFSGIVDINIVAIDTVMKRYGINDNSVFRRVLAACRAHIKDILDKLEAKRHGY